MSSSTPAPGTAPTSRSRRIILASAGAGVAAVVGGVLFQILKPPTAYSDTPREKTAQTAQPGQTKNYVGRVNGELIKYDDLAGECVNRHGKEILDSMINRMIIQQACDKQGITVTNVEVDEEIKKIAKRFNLSVETWLAMLQQEREVSIAQYGRDIIWPMLALRKLAGEQVTITSKELQEAFVREYGERVKAKVIVLNNSRTANEVWAQAKKDPKNFEELVYKYSIDPQSKPLGGAVPPIQRFAGNTLIEDKAFALKEGEISALIQVDERQWIIIKCEGRTEKTVSDIKEVENQLKDQLKEEKMQKGVAKIFKKLKDESRVDNYLTGVASGAPRKGAPAPSTSQEPIQRTSASAPPSNKAAPNTRSADASTGRTAQPKTK